MSKPSLPMPNEQPSTLVIDISHCIQVRDFEIESPYNVFLAGQKSLIIIANKEQANLQTIQLLTLGLSSLIEHYFRSVISKAVLLCRQSLASALKTAKISLAAANYYKDVNLGRAIFDSVNFSDKSIIAEQTNDFLGINLVHKGAPDGIKTALDDLQKIFILRHAVVHANGFLSPKNLMSLHFPCDAIAAVSSTYESFENMVAVALNSIQSYNSFLFKCLIQRAHANNHILFDGSAADIVEFERYWLTFMGRDCPESLHDSLTNYVKAKTYFEAV